MLKPLFSKYNDWGNQRWIKLKKDFIPGAGDTIDFEVVGASWQVKRARELLGAFLSSPSVRRVSLILLCSPHFHLYHLFYWHARRSPGCLTRRAFLSLCVSLSSLTDTFAARSKAALSYPLHDLVRPHPQAARISLPQYSLKSTRVL